MKSFKENNHLDNKTETIILEKTDSYLTLKLSPQDYQERKPIIKVGSKNIMPQYNLEKEKQLEERKKEFFSSIAIMFIFSTLIFGLIGPTIILILPIILLLITSNFQAKNDKIIVFDDDNYVIKGKNVGHYTNQKYELVKKYAPEELDNWIEAIIDSGTGNSDQARFFADNVIKLAKNREQKEKDTIAKTLDMKWENKNESVRMKIGVEKDLNNNHDKTFFTMIT